MKVNHKKVIINKFNQLSFLSFPPKFPLFFFWRDCFSGVRTPHPLTFSISHFPHTKQGRDFLSSLLFFFSFHFSFIPNKVTNYLIGIDFIIYFHKSYMEFFLQINLISEKLKNIVVNPLKS